MSLARHAEHDFEEAIRIRGLDYLNSGLVKLTSVNHADVAAKVKGNGAKYDVSLSWFSGEQVLAADCTCPYFSDSGLCKHIWATILSAERQGWLLGERLGGDFEVIHRDVWESDDLPAEANQPATSAQTETALKHLTDYFGSKKEAEEFLHANPEAVMDLVNATTMRKSSVPAWKRRMERLSDERVRSTRKTEEPQQAKKRRLWFVLNVAQTMTVGNIVIEFYVQQQKKDGSYGRFTRYSVTSDQIGEIEDQGDHQLLQMLFGALPGSTGQQSYYDYQNYRKGRTACEIPASMFDYILPALCGSERFIWLLDTRQSLDEGNRIFWDEGDPWRFELAIESDEELSSWTVNGDFVRGEHQRPVTEAIIAFQNGLVLFPEGLAKLDVGESFGWITSLRRDGAFRVPYEDREAFLQTYWSSDQLPEASFPENLKLEEVKVAPKGHVIINSPPAFAKLTASLSFRYGEELVGYTSGGVAMLTENKETVIRRDPTAEAELINKLRLLGFESLPTYYKEYGQFGIAPTQLHMVCEQLIEAGWEVEAHGARMRAMGSVSMSVKSEVDWFELKGQIQFGDAVAKLPALLEAARHGRRFVTLDDGSHGMLPEEWLRQYGRFAEMGELDGDAVRFKPSQAMLLDAMLESQENVTIDSQFRKLRETLQEEVGAKPQNEPRSFQGELRDYQRAGLGWLHFLRRIKLGGCLADDMGLGKTIQVLALLENRRTRRLKKDEVRKPSIVVVPKSLVFNWVEEAKVFTPKLRVLNYTGVQRNALLDDNADVDVIVTTYGTLRRDIATLKDTKFDYAILDEAQAIKNSNSQAAKSCRLLTADHRLAMTGTPVENHLGELWSLFEFLNPGMLGMSKSFQTIATKGEVKDQQAIRILGAGLRPFILRRTKSQVLHELPEKTEQTLYCELSGSQKETYDELRNYYLQMLSKKISKDGMNKSKMHVLEALLRLRQVACHPGLIDKGRAEEGSAKIDTLLDQLEEIVAEGHKVLVFSQFTSLLAIVRSRLEAKQVTYEYLDGKTRKRQERVERFQSDDQCPVFLISLKAGGHGLNLTAADYVFILDPWWNPAVEAQAVDRAHRIGQQRHVFAYRMICKGTVEEKILELQSSKRELADAIISEDNSVLRNLTTDDLNMLLS